SRSAQVSLFNTSFPKQTSSWSHGQGTPMSGFLSMLNPFRSTRTSSPATRRPRSARLEVECLDQRLLPSASSYNLHAVVDAQGSSAAFFRSPTDDVLYELQNGTLTARSTPHAVSDFSAGLDRAGHANVFAHYNGHMYMYNEAGWFVLNEPMAMRSFAAVNGGRCYFV